MGRATATTTADERAAAGVLDDDDDGRESAEPRLAETEVICWGFWV
jgi:hypothetical protein